MATKIKFTPLANVRWIYLFDPCEPFNKSQDPKYKITLVFDPKDPQWQKWCEDLDAELEKLGLANSNIKIDKDKEGKLTGKKFVTFKTGVSFPPKVLDKNGTPIEPCKIGQGSVARVAYTQKPYSTFGGGMSLYLSAVQITDLEVYSDNPFEVEEFSGDDIPF